MSLSLSVRAERWPIAGRFAIARGAKTESHVVVAELSDGRVSGRGECVPYGRYGETVETVIALIETTRTHLADGLDRTRLQTALPSGAARNALDCAFWDLEAKSSGRAAHEIASLPPPGARVTAFTISLDTPDAMGEAARKASARKLLKVKLGSTDDSARIRAVRAAAPHAELIVDANEAWRAETLVANLAACADVGVTLIEQPLPAQQDDALASVVRTIPICADESAHDRGSVAALVGKYDAVNIKLDKTGGLTEALLMAAEAKRLRFAVMAGCMVATSLSMAPAMLLAQRARIVDLDGPLLLARDRAHGLRYEESLVYPATPELWG